MSVSVRVATAGLVVVMFVLTSFSVVVAFSNSTGTERAQQAAADSDLFQRAAEALLVQEEAAEEVVGGDDSRTRRDYADADASTREALEDLDQVTGESFGADEREELLVMHQRYGAATELMFQVAVDGPEAAELFEDASVDPYFDPLAATLDAQLKSRYSGARDSLGSIARAQQLLQLATPALFAVALALLATFVVMLSRSRRLVVAQADRNRHQSLHDSLTGLPNRKALHERGAGCLQHARVTGNRTALLLLDLDRFKEVNDTLGHHHGDLVLQAVSRQLLLALRPTDIVARLGGDEFAILLPEVGDASTALSVAAKLQDALSASLDVGGILLDVEISMGVVLSGIHGDDIPTLLQHADIAMYRAKHDDLGVCLYDESLNETSRDQLRLLGELRRAIDNGELVLHFQPQVTLSTGRCDGAEALLRWNHPTRGLVPPAFFIPAAERTALIGPLTRWVLDAALAECRTWHTNGRPLKVAVNVSARNLSDPAFADDVLHLLAQWDLPASCLLLEVTESTIMVDPARAGAILQRFVDIGIELAIDDFGAGYTSLAHLWTLPVHELKIDQSLIRQMSCSVAGTLIVRAMIDLAHSLGLRTVAEGVEDATTLEQLRGLGCDVAQGHHLAQAMPAVGLRAWNQRLLAVPPPRPRP